MAKLKGLTARDARGGKRRRGTALCAAVASVAVPLNAAATTNIWNGGSGDWNNAANWSTGVVPNAPDADVYIDGGNAIASAVTNSGTATITMRNLTIDADDSLALSLPANFTSWTANFYGDINLNGGLRVNGGVIGRFNNSATIGGSGSVTLVTSAQIVASGTATTLTLGPGMTLVSSNTSNSSVVASLSGQIVNQGLIATAPTGSYLTINGSAFTNSGSILMSNRGLVVLDSTNIVNSGTISLKNGFLILDPPSKGNGTFQNTGWINLDDGYLSIERSVSLADLGTINHSATSAGTIDLVYTGILLNTGQNFVLDSTTPPWIIERGGTIQGGTLTFLPGANVSVIAGVFEDVTLASNWTLPGNLSIRKDFTLANAVLTSRAPLSFDDTGSQAIKGSGEIHMIGGQITKNAGILTIGQGVFMHGNGTLSGGIINRGTIMPEASSFGTTITLLSTFSSYGFTNRGTMNVPAGATLSVRELITQDAGSLVVDGLLGSASTLRQTINVTGGTLSGNGTLDVNVNLGGTISPGHSIGALTMTGALTLTGGAHYAAEIDGNNAADLLAVSGDLTIAPGDYLDVTDLGGGESGSAYLIATYGGTLSGAFDHVSPGYDITYAPGQIFVTPTPEPTSLMLAIAGAPLLLGRGRHNHLRSRRRCSSIAWN